MLTSDKKLSFRTAFITVCTILTIIIIGALSYSAKASGTAADPNKEQRFGVHVNSGHTALRSERECNPSNEIGTLTNGDYVVPVNTQNSTYWYVYSPKTGCYGYVNSNYLFKLKEPAVIQPTLSLCKGSFASH